jgi:hypothetical protein
VGSLALGSEPPTGHTMGVDNDYVNKQGGSGGPTQTAVRCLRVCAMPPWFGPARGRLSHWPHPSLPRRPHALLPALPSPLFVTCPLCYVIVIALKDARQAVLSRLGTVTTEQAVVVAVGARSLWRLYPASNAPPKIPQGSPPALRRSHSSLHVVVMLPLVSLGALANPVTTLPVHGQPCLAPSPRRWTSCWSTWGVKRRTRPPASSPWQRPRLCRQVMEGPVAVGALQARGCFGDTECVCVCVETLTVKDVDT